jgi:hypothetical protein
MLVDMQVATETTNTQHRTFQSGRWVTEKTYSAAYSICKQTLTNWRYRDRLAGRAGALPGYPVYRRFGRAIRYWLPAETGGYNAA